MWTEDSHAVRLSMKVGHRALAVLVDEMAGGKTVEPEGGVKRVRIATRDGVGEAPAGSRRRLEAAVAPAGVKIEPIDRSGADDGRTVHRHVHHAAPGPRDPQPPEH